jgi:hypothetical protein
VGVASGAAVSLDGGVARATGEAGIAAPGIVIDAGGMGAAGVAAGKGCRGPDKI